MNWTLNRSKRQLPAPRDARPTATLGAMAVVGGIVGVSILGGGESWGQAETTLTGGFASAVQTAAAPGAALRFAPTPPPPLPRTLPQGVLQYEPLIMEAAASVGLDPLALAALVSVECPSGNAGCTSPGIGAMGLTQFMPGTAAAVAQRSGLPCLAQAYDPETSLRCGAFHFVELLRQCADLWAPGLEGPALACAGSGYNAGPGTIGAFKAAIRSGVPVREAARYSETQRWVTLFLDVWEGAGRH